MREHSKVLWTPDKDTAPQDVEGLCVGQLGRDGYWKSVTIGGGEDRGCDAESVYWRGRTEHH